LETGVLFFRIIRYLFSNIRVFSDRKSQITIYQESNKKVLNLRVEPWTQYKEPTRRVGVLTSIPLKKKD